MRFSVFFENPFGQEYGEKVQNGFLLFWWKIMHWVNRPWIWIHTRSLKKSMDQQWRASKSPWWSAFGSQPRDMRCRFISSLESGSADSFIEAVFEFWTGHGRACSENKARMKILGEKTWAWILFLDLSRAGEKALHFQLSYSNWGITSQTASSQSRKTRDLIRS